MIRTRRSAWLGVLMAAVTLLGACSDGAQQASDIVSDQEAQRYREETSEQERIDKANADLPSRPSGLVDIDGSTRGSLTPAAARTYGGAAGATTVNVADRGEDRAFQELCAGEIDLVDSARPISRAEWEACRSVGLDVVQFQIAAEGVVVAIKSETDVGGDCLDTDQIEDIYRAGSPVTNWGQVGLDDVALRVGGPDPDNNAFSFFGRYVLGAPEPALTNYRSDYAAFDNDKGSRLFVIGKERDERLAATYADRARRRDLLKSEVVSAWQVVVDARNEVRIAEAERAKGIRDRRSLADQQRDVARVRAAIVARDAAEAKLRAVRARYADARERLVTAAEARRLVETSRGHVAYFRFSYYELFEDQLRPFEITLPSGERNCIFPSQRTITSGEYPLARQLLVTTTTRSLARREVTDFLKYYLRHTQEEATSARLVPLPDDTVSLQLAWLTGETPPTLVKPEEEQPDGQPSEPAPSVRPAR